MRTHTAPAPAPAPVCACAPTCVCKESRSVHARPCVCLCASRRLRTDSLRLRLVRASFVFLCVRLRTHVCALLVSGRKVPRFEANVNARLGRVHLEATVRATVKAAAGGRCDHALSAIAFTPVYVGACGHIRRDAWGKV
eukprot:1513547-Pleurochrysis_carterae.AAC.1